MVIRKAKPRKQSERGYILITAIWLLLLGASIVSLLILKNLNHGEEITYEREQLELRYAQESAIETVVADMLFNGPRGEFVTLPTETSYEFGDDKVDVFVTSESGKIDVNQSEPALIDRALRGFGISALSRNQFLSKIEEIRRSGNQFQSNGDVEKATELAGIVGTNDFCISQYFTVYSGLSSPQPSQMEERLATALGQTSQARGGKFSPGSAIRVEVKPDVGSPLVAMIRTSGLIGESHSILDWRYGNFCGERSPN